MSEIHEGAIEKIKFVKTFNEINMNHRLPLPHLVHTPIYKHGFSSQDVERWYSTDPYVQKSDVSLIIPNGLKAKVVTETEERFGTNVVKRYKSVIEKIAKRRGKGFHLRIPIVGDFVRGFRDIADTQVNSFLLKYCENPLNWVVNRSFVEIQEMTTESDSISVSMSPLSRELRTSRAIPQMRSAINNLRKRVYKLATKNKRELKKSGQTWRFRISKLNMFHKFGGEDWQRTLGEEVLHIGHFVEAEKLYFCDTSYFVFEQDLVEVLPFEGLEIEPYEYILIALVEEGADKPRIRPLGLVRTRPYEYV